MKKHEHIVSGVVPGSIAEELEIGAGDKLLAVDGHEIEDIFDYQFYTEDEEIVLLIEKPDGEKICDDFAHEQSLLLSEGDKLFLFCGCAHAGIVNIVEQARELTGRWPDYVVGGFHLSNPSSHRMEAPEMINGVAGRLLETGAVYYTCHCTGQEVYQIMRERMGDRVRYLAAGDRVVL